MTTIVVFVGSLREDSINKKLAKSLENLAPEGTRFEYVDMNLPLYNTDIESPYPESPQKAKDIVRSADGVLVVTPEYNRSVPGVLKNAIDWLSRPYGDNVFNDKPLALAGASVGPIGTAVAQSDMRHIAGYLNMRLVGQPELYFTLASDKFGEDGLAKAEHADGLKAFIDNFVAFIKRS